MIRAVLFVLTFCGLIVPGMSLADERPWYRDVDPLAGNWYVTAAVGHEASETDELIVSIRPHMETVCDVVGGGCIYRIEYSEQPRREMMFRVGVTDYGVDHDWSEITAIDVSPSSLRFFRGTTISPRLRQVEMTRSSESPLRYSGTWHFINIHGQRREGQEQWSLMTPRVEAIGLSVIRPWNRRDVVPPSSVHQLGQDGVARVTLQDRETYDWSDGRENPLWNQSRRAHFRVFLYGENLRGAQHITFPESVDFQIVNQGDLRSEPYVDGSRDYIGKYVDVILWGHARPGLHQLRVNDQYIPVLVEIPSAEQDDGHVIGAIAQRHEFETDRHEREAAARRAEVEAAEAALTAARREHELAEQSLAFFREAALEIQRHWAAEQEETSVEYTILAAEIQAAEVVGEPVSDAARARELDLRMAMRQLVHRRETDWQEFLETSTPQREAVETARAAMTSAHRRLIAAHGAANQVQIRNRVIDLRTDHAAFRRVSAEEFNVIQGRVTALTEEIADRRARRTELLQPRSDARAFLVAMTRGAEEANDQLLASGVLSLMNQAGLEMGSVLVEAAGAFVEGGPYAAGASALRLGIATAMSPPNYYESAGPMIPRDVDPRYDETEDVYLSETWLYQEAVREAQRIPLGTLQAAATANHTARVASQTRALVLGEVVPDTIRHVMRPSLSLYGRMQRAQSAARAAQMAWARAAGQAGRYALARSMLGGFARGFGESAAREAAKIAVAEALEHPALVNYMAAQIDVARAVLSLQAAGDDYWENEDMIVIAEGLIEGLSRRVAGDGWIVRYNTRFQPRDGLNLTLTLADGADAPADFEAQVLLNGVPLQRDADRASLRWVLPAGVEFGAPSADGLQVTILTQ